MSEREKEREKRLHILYVADRENASSGVDKVVCYDVAHEQTSHAIHTGQAT